MLESIRNFLIANPFIDKFMRSAIVILVLLGIQRFIAYLFKKTIRKSDVPQYKTYLSVIAKTIEIVVYFLVFVIALGALGVETTPMVAIASAISVALGLGSQAFIRDLLSGFFILSENHFSLGEVISVNGVTGVVESITLRATRLRNSVTGEQYIISNGDIKMVTNMSRDYRMAVVDVLVPYHFDIDTTIGAIESLLESYKRKTGMSTMPHFEGVISLEERYYVLRVSCTTTPEKHWRIESEIRRDVVRCLRDHGITLSTKTPKEAQDYTDSLQ